ncbi:hypothetical protein F4802DRAFT_584133 [Xylaria palmicola]|nr:hypothetical protein F4802DRAFT_584133 [Xylaria palmicola]
MLEYFTYKKVKKHREEKAAENQKTEKGKGKEEEKQKEKPVAGGGSGSKPPAHSPPPQIISTPAEDDDDVAIEGTPVLDREDEKFLERLTSAHSSARDGDEDETPPPLPPRVKTPVIDIDSDASSVASKGGPKDVDAKGKEKGAQDAAPGDKPKRFTFFSRNLSIRRKPVPSSRPQSGSGLQPSHLAVPDGGEAAHETSEMARVLDDLDLVAAKNNRAFSLSGESADMARRFTQVLRDLVNGVPTAYGDLVALLEDRDGVLARSYEKLPRGLKKLVAQLPDKLTSSLAPELLAAAAEAQGLKPEGGGGLAGAAKRLLTPGNLHDLVTKPGALVGLLKGIVNALKTRFPAFVGTNVLWSLAVFLLLSMLWYCYRRGREVRLEREAEEAEEAAARAEGRTTTDDNTIEGRARVEELPDDPMLAAPETAGARS